jgi:hypothetical protein
MKHKYTYRKSSNAPSPSLETLLMANARELLTTWEVLRDKQLVDKHLASLDKVYGANVEQKVRQYMREINKNERNAR